MQQLFGQKVLNDFIQKQDEKLTKKIQERNFKQEWQAIFENDKTLTCKLKTEIEKTDKEIDKMVYELYGLSDEDIMIVKGI
jgi:hypothetical protein